MKSKRNWALIGAVFFAALALSACGPAKFEAKTTGSEDYMEKVKSGQPLYTAPQGSQPTTGQTSTGTK